jgi:hypothetical protein
MTVAELKAELDQFPEDAEMEVYSASPHYMPIGVLVRRPEAGTVCIVAENAPRRARTTTEAM